MRYCSPRLVKGVTVIVAIEAGPFDAEPVDSHLQALQLTLIPLAARRALGTRDVVLFLRVIAQLEAVLIAQLVGGFQHGRHPAAIA